MPQPSTNGQDPAHDVDVVTVSDICRAFGIDVVQKRIAQLRAEGRSFAAHAIEAELETRPPLT